ncbi:MAG TPA: pentapeptide repeat-containing protein [Phycisphaerae bacterium]|nr:pentapeptide repeat-containing protein [Phycisphaerae bacterium]
MDAQLTRVNFRDCMLAESDMTRCQFSKADLTNAKMSGVHLNGADLRDTKLAGARLFRADLEGCRYEPLPGSLPDIAFLSGTVNLSRMWYTRSPHALLELREALHGPSPK